MFRSAFKRTRCIVPASGYYEWRAMEGGKQPYFISAANGAVLSIAGLWDQWKEPESGETISSATLIVTAANDFTRSIHDRMPVLLVQRDIDAWLSGKAGVELLQPAPNDLLRMWPGWVALSTFDRYRKGSNCPCAFPSNKKDNPRMKRIMIIAAMALASASGAQAGCIVADPSPTPLNVRTAPYGRIVGTLDNGQGVSILDSSIDNQGRPWVYVADDTGSPLGWVYREYVVCKGEMRQ
jgi:hypothetical protein